MYHSKYIIPGLVIFFLLFSFPFWFNGAKQLMGAETYERPKLALPEGQTECIESVEFMRAEHMQLLNHWRDKVVREGNRVYTASNGKAWTISLQNTCMDCHSDKAEFCDKCHDTNSVSPYCWTCHLQPKGNE